MVRGRAANRLQDVWKSIGVVCEGEIGVGLDGFWRMQLGYAVIRRSRRLPRLWWRQVRLNIIWEVNGGECSRLEAR